MTISKKQYKDKDLGVDMTPMLDIVFILLIFFIVTTSFVKELAIEAQRNESTHKSVNKGNSLSIEITANEVIWLSYADKPKRQVDLERVEANIERALAEIDTQSVVIKASPDARHNIVFKVMDHIKSIPHLSIVIMSDSG